MFRSEWPTREQLELNDTAVSIDAVDGFRLDLARLSDPEAGPLLVAVFGRVDSPALLLLSNAAHCGQLYMATVGHGLRPEAAAEAVFVADFRAGLGVTWQADTTLQ